MKTTKSNLPDYLFSAGKKLSPQSESAGKFWQRFTVQQMQSIPQYSAYKSIIDLTVR